MATCCHAHDKVNLVHLCQLVTNQMTSHAAGDTYQRWELDPHKLIACELYNIRTEIVFHNLISSHL